MGIEKSVVLKIEMIGEQQVGGIAKITGLVKAKNLIQIIDILDLEANPRSSRTGNVTNSIQDSIKTDPLVFPFKTKGILLAASEYQRLDRGRFSLNFANPDTEGILDGGHNMLAIGLHIMRLAYEYAEIAFPKSSLTWSEFKDMWHAHRGIIKKYQEYIQKSDEDNPDNLALSFFVPVELLLPSDTDDYFVVEQFKSSLLDICAARNNNVELHVGAKANQRGYFDELSSLLEKHQPELFEKIEWKTNDGGDIKIADLISLCWIPLALTSPVHDDAGKLVEPPAPNKLYSGKGDCLLRYERYMSSPEVTKVTSGGYKRELSNPEVYSAIEVATELPSLYDYIYEKFPELYNKADGLYGRITVVNKMNENRKTKRAPFSGKTVPTLSPDGFIVPLVYGLTALLVKIKDGEKSRIVWVTDPMEFLIENLPSIVRRYKNVLPPWDYDPQKVGKAPQSYSAALDAYKMALRGID